MAGLDPARARLEEGMRVRREVLGDGHVDDAEARKSEFTADFQDFLTRYGWGEIWIRPGLDRRARSLITLAVLIATDKFAELPMHVRAARRNGVTREEIKELILHCAIYLGLPAANEAFPVAERALEEHDAAGS
jgi:4-carboxymuconolactone decarboxylase